MKEKIIFAVIALVIILGCIVGWNYLPASFRIPISITALVAFPLGFVGGVYVRKWWEKHVTK